jgi:hypothetical protein
MRGSWSPSENRNKNEVISLINNKLPKNGIADSAFCPKCFM